MKFETHVLIVAGGYGKRMGNKLAKQFLLLNGIPMLFHSINSFLFLQDVKITLVLSSDQFDYWKTICKAAGFNVPHIIAEGGPTRFHSVKSGLKHIPINSLVLIHDASRPFVSKDTIVRVIDMAKHKGNAVPAIEIKDSIREISGTNNKRIDRRKLRIIQTPQGFKSSLIKEAYNQSYNNTFTDDASVLETAGIKINIVEGNTENIKLSNPIDIIIGENILKRGFNS